MAEKTDSVDMLLTYSEIRLVASLLGQQTIVGLEAVPNDTEMGTRSANYDREASQSLLARQLASISENGLPRIDRRVVNAVRTCAYPQRVMIAQKVNEDQHSHSTLVYLAANMSVVIRVVGVNKYRLSLYAKSADALMRFENYWMSDKILSPNPNITLVISEAVLITVRELAIKHDMNVAQQTLNQAGVNQLSTKLFTQFLNKPHSFTVIQGIHFNNAQLTIRSASLLQNGISAWLMIETPDSTSTARQCVLSNVSAETVHQLIQRLIVS